MKCIRGKNLTKLITHDLTVGILYKWPKFLGAAIIFILPCMTYYTAAKRLGFMSPGFIDYIIYIFKGMRIYIPNPNEQFEIPFIYLIFNIYLAFIIGNYPLKDLYGSAQNILIRSGDRSKWWLSKSLWNAANVLLYYILLIMICLLLTVATGGLLTLAPNHDLNMIFTGIITENADIYQVLINAFAVPLLTSVSISLIQMVLSFYIKPVLSYIVIVSLFVISAYYYSYFFIGNYMMLQRSCLFLENGLKTEIKLIVNGFLIILSFLTGLLRFNSMDILDKSNVNVG